MLCLIINLFADIDEEFLNGVKELYEHISRNIRPNLYDGAPVTGYRMVQICRIYEKHMKMDKKTKMLSLDEVRPKNKLWRNLWFQTDIAHSTMRFPNAWKDF